jgi:hypothetical protein
LAASASCAQIAALSADVPKRSQQLLPQRGRVLGLEGARPLAVHPVATLSIAGLSQHPRLSDTRWTSLANAES